MSAHLPFYTCDTLANRALEREVRANPELPAGITVKTNFVGLAVLGANISLEYDIIPHLSVAIPVYYSGWDHFKETLKLRGLVIQPEIRYYIKGNDGFYGGAHFGMGYYNFALGGEFRIQDHKGRTPALGGGVSIGYAHRFKKTRGLGLEFAIGGGAYKVSYDVLYNEPNGAYAEHGIEDLFIGVDNVSISLTYTFPIKKEGRK